MNIQLNKDTSHFELLLNGGVVFLKVSSKECATKKIAREFFERQLSNMLTGWMPVKQDS